MKRIETLLLSTLLLFGTASCKGFLDFSPSDQIPADQAFTTARRTEAARVGLYDIATGSGAFGRDAVATADLATDVSWSDGSSGWLKEVYELHSLQATDKTLDRIWNRLYMLCNASANIITGGQALLSGGTLHEADTKVVQNAIGHAYGMKALANLYLVNYFALPYSEATKGTPGIILIKDKPIKEDEKVTRSTVGEVYAQILSDIEQAKKYMKDGQTALDPFAMDELTVLALEARVKLYMKDYAGAVEAAKKVIDSGKYSLLKGEAYLSAWTKLDPSPEYIYAVAMTLDDHISSNSINNLYGSYNSFISPTVTALMGAKDIRNSLLNATETPRIRGLKFKGVPGAENVSNVPVIRYSEMFLIMAEAKAQLGQTTEAVESLFEVASRNPDLQKSAIPTEKAALLKFISEERIREFFQEGHRFFDARRNGEIVSRAGNLVFTFQNWDIAKFVFPIPDAECKASGLPQNTDWYKQKPTFKKAQ